MNILPALAITSDALNAEKVRLEVISQNIANAQTTRGPDGNPYQRRVVAFEAQLQRASGTDGSSLAAGPRLAGITADTTAGPSIYNPSHPHADAQGMVRMPNVNLSREMVDLISASRSYEANLSVVRTARQMAQRALQMGR
ncbi:MAG: flagellar basal body rod protein FlgC [Opitutaceae bacterium]